MVPLCNVRGRPFCCQLRLLLRDSCLPVGFELMTGTLTRGKELLRSISRHTLIMARKRNRAR